MKKRLLMATAFILCGLSVPAHAAVTTYSHTWTGTEVIQAPKRIFRDGTPSVAGSPKTFPGDFNNNPTYFITHSLNVVLGSVVSVATIQDTNSFFSLYENAFDPTDLATGYLGDQGFSGNGTFSIMAPASGNVLLVVMSNSGSGAIGASWSADVTHSPAAVPESSLAGFDVLALLGTCLIGGRALRRRKKGLTQSVA
jgi:hypothetical protein